MNAPSACPRCGKPASGNFCATCGASLQARGCPTCGAPAQPGARFCTSCGGALAGAPAGASGGGGGGRRGTAPPKAAAAPGGAREPHLGWWAAGGLLVVLMLVVAWPVLRPQPSAPGGGAPANGAPAGAGPGAVDLSSMTPRQAADRLHDRVMMAAEAGDSATAAGFVPMAISAYEQARPLDADGLFHLSALQRVAGDFQGAVATAEEALATQPNHLLNLYAAAEASREMGEAGQARAYFQRLLDAWDSEMASGNVDYQAHQGMMENVRRTAADFMAVTG